MKSKEFFRKLTSRYLIGNLVAMAAVVALLCVGLKFGLAAYTHHGEAISVPDVRHRLFNDARALLEGAGLDIVVTDTGYVKTLPADCILEQTPAAGYKAKAGHVVYVTVNASHSPTLVIPDIIDNSSYREAKAKLIAMGFKLSEPRLIPGEKDWVYGVTVNGRHLNVGDRVPVDAKLVILVGDGLRDDDGAVDYVDGEDPMTEGDFADPATESTPEESTGGTDVDEFEEIP